jgi:hypothetical protein
MTGSDDEFDDFLRRRRRFGRPDDGLEPPAELDRLVLRQAREAIEAEKPHRVFRAPAWGMPVALAATLVLAFTIILHVGAPVKSRKAEVTVQTISRTMETPPAADAMAPAAPEARAVAAPEAPPLAEQSADRRAVVVDLGTSNAADPGSASASAPASASMEMARERRVERVADAARPAAAPSFASDEEAARYSQPMGASNRTAAGDTRSSTSVIIDGQRVDATSSGDLRVEPAPASAKASAPAWRRDSRTWLAEIERLRAAGDNARADAELAEYKREHRAYAGAPDR